MSWISRRKILGATALGIVSTSAHHIWAGEAGNNSQTDTTEKQTEAKPLALENYQPRSILHLRFPNMHVDTAARLNELGRQPRASRKFFDKYQDRIVFGTDATPHGDRFPQQVFNDSLYEIYFRFLETDDEYFDYAPASTPPQGRWRISGIHLPDTILRKVYNQNAARLLNIKVGAAA
jgi:predicted TIM-barrel fold metal-dependent hydrolase